MGTTTFMLSVPLDIPGYRRTVEQAFHDSQKAETLMSGGGMNGTITAKDSYILIHPFGTLEAVAGKRAAVHEANKVLHSGHPRITDKHGPAGAIVYTDGLMLYVLFFGWASELERSRT